VAMPVSVKTCATPAEAAAALSSDRGARYIAGGTLVMRALNGGDVGITTLVRLADRGLGQIRTSGARIVLGAETTLAQILRERDLGFLHPVVRSIGGPAVRTMGTVGGSGGLPLPQGLPRQAEGRLRRLHRGSSFEHGRTGIQCAHRLWRHGAD